MHRGTPQTFSYRFVQGFFVVVHTADAPSDAEWDDFCARVRERRGATEGVFVFTNGGTPSSKQRGELRDAIQDNAAATAVLTTSALVRGAMTSLNWFFPSRVVAFAPRDVGTALEFLQERTETVVPVHLLLRTLHGLADEMAQTLPSELLSAESTRDPRHSVY